MRNAHRADCYCCSNFEEARQAESVMCDGLLRRGMLILLFP